MSKSFEPTNWWMFRGQQIATFAFLVYVLILLGRSAWTNAESNKKIDELRATIENIKVGNETLSETIIYQQTNTFKELEARRKLNVKRPGEIVVALPPEPTEEENATITETSEIESQTALKSWWEYFFS